jgi:hypothetical protein
MLQLPPFEFSYETVSHKNVPDSYNLALAIPGGKKCCVWFSFDHTGDHMYLLDLNKDKKIVKTTPIESSFDVTLAYGTLLYGAMIPDTNAFIIEDVFIYKGSPMKTLNVGQKLYYIYDFLENHMPHTDDLTFSMPVFWCGTEHVVAESEIPYSVHHIQYRSLTTIVPYLNVPVNKKPVVDKNVTPTFVQKSTVRPDFNKAQYKCTTVFQVTADTRYDIYNLFAHGDVFYNVAHIPGYKTSVMMNRIFRKIRENENLDYIEESDDEIDFENADCDRYVDLNKKVLVECVFNNKFKRWIPVRLASPGSRIVNISQLCYK